LEHIGFQWNVKRGHNRTMRKSQVKSDPILAENSSHGEEATGATKGCFNDDYSCIDDNDYFSHVATNIARSTRSNNTHEANKSHIISTYNDGQGMKGRIESSTTFNSSTDVNVNIEDYISEDELDCTFAEGGAIVVPVVEV